jgi:hypothetical protein
VEARWAAAKERSVSGEAQQGDRSPQPFASIRVTPILPPHERVDVVPVLDVKTRAVLNDRVVVKRELGVRAERAVVDDHREQDDEEAVGPAALGEDAREPVEAR